MIQEIVKKHEKALVEIIIIAKEQGMKINYSTIAFVCRCSTEELPPLVNYLQEQGVTTVYEDIEPDGTADDEEEPQLTMNPFEPTKIDIKMEKLTIDSLIRRIQYEELEFDSSFQRKAGLWSEIEKSQLIESILLRIPLPAFYFDASDDDKWLIIDGLQRVSTIRDFVVDEKLTLTGMEFLKDLNGLNYDQLPRSFQRRFVETGINVYLVNPGTPPNVKFNIFRRINTAGLQLESQEIRNALYQGGVAEFLAQMAKTPSFVTATCGSVKIERMLDREFCLRFVAFTKMDIETYHSTIDDFLDNTMEHLKKTPNEELLSIQESFDRSMQICSEIFGEYAFRKLRNDKHRNAINKTLFEAWSRSIFMLDDKSAKILVENKEEVTAEFRKLCMDAKFTALLKRTKKTDIKRRLECVDKLVQKILKKG